MRIKVNETGMINNLGRTFSNTTSWLPELLQNARRAGATSVDIDYQHPNIVIHDNGTGIENWDSLLTIAESAWNPESGEAPFGLGFFACLYVTSMVAVESGDKLLFVNSKQILGGGKTSLTQVEPCEGTKVTLTLTSEEVSEVEIRFIARGLNMDVVLNGLTLSQVHRQKNDAVHIEGLGYLDKKVLTDSNRPEIIFYYQGVRVGRYTRNSYWLDSMEDKAYSLHLDNKFEVKLPDRNRLVNHEDTLKQIREQLKQAKVEWLKERLEEFERSHQCLIDAHIAFLNVYLNQIDWRRGWGVRSSFHHLLADEYEEITVESYPMNFDYYPDEVFPCHGLESQQKVRAKNGGGVQMSFDRFEVSDLFGPLMWAWELGLTFYSDAAPSKAVLVEASDFEVITFREKETRGTFRAQAVFADEVYIRCNHPEVERPDVRIRDPFCFDGIMYFPKADSISSDKIALQSGRFLDYEQEVFVDSDYCAYCQDLQAFIDFNQSPDEKEYLKASLNNGNLPEQFAGKTATIKLGAGAPNIVDQIITIHEENSEHWRLTGRRCGSLLTGIQFTVTPKVR